MKKLSSYHEIFPKKTPIHLLFNSKSIHMNVNRILTRGFTFTLLIILVSTLIIACKKELHEEKKSVQEQELKQLREAVSSFGDIRKAQAAGYDTEVTGYRSQMGFHYINASLVDDKFEITKPELLLYAPYGKDSLKFVAVEYATPINDINNPPPVPEGFSGSNDVWEINTEFNLWTLHVWVKLENPHGIFAPHNTKLP
ncbi:hypothetical protein GXP67_00405 [Rhodocytophaga rosea]|uniref:Uncharacterized protein n=1 Tax=Rhodocytophaga rosea TaxID=2704465 RepID=A0A6C0GBD0_9BACT|nr:hypothetical protein [Rhodocytophaga rosea]QHT65241.1 hypothetical protein GXP67_00405 [Rhodocytophaga rosea]